MDGYHEKGPNGTYEGMDVEYLNILRKNLHETVKEKYNLSNVVRERAEWYKQILNLI